MDRRTQAERRAASRSALIEAATALFGELGYAGTTLRDIGERAGVSSGLVAYHFGSKEALFEAVMESIREVVTETASRSGVPELRGLDRLEGLLAVYLRGYIRPPTIERPEPGGSLGRTVFVAMAEAISATPELRRVVAANDALFRRQITDALREAVDDGVVQIDAATDPETEAVVIMGMVRGIALQHLVSPAEVDIEAALANVLAMIGRHYRADANSDGST
ncbi:MAG: TetR family transcriptional regulator [Actinomycetota bacterium]